jgi:hypothetical protein
MPAVTKRVLLLLLAVVILLDIASILVFSRNNEDPVTQGAATGTRRPPGVSPVTVSPPAVVSGERASPTPTATPTREDPVATDADQPDSASVIHVNGLSFVGRPFETIAMRGTYARAGAGTVLRVQVQVGGDWVNFPLPTITDESGGFTAHVELGDPGEHRVRIVDQSSGTSSETVIVVIR